MSSLASGNQRPVEETQVKRRSDSSFDRMSLAEETLPKADRTDILRRTIESEIIPRLMLSSRSSAAMAVTVGSSSSKVRAEDVLEFTDLLLTGNPSEVAAVVDQLLDEGVSHAVIMLDLFAKAAKRLGELWETDERNFAEITLGMGMLQKVLHLLDGEGVDPSHDVSRKILLTPVAGDQHFYPVLILDAFFARSGWQVERLLSYDRRWIEAFINKRHLDVIGLSISQESLLDQLASDIQSVRRKSCNRSLVVLVGGRVFFGHPELVAQVGADATAEDANSAVGLAERLVSPAGVAHL